MAQLRIQPQINPDFSYPAGTLLGKWRFRIQRGAYPAHIQEIDEPLPAEVVFDGVESGTYALTIVRLSASGTTVGPTVSKSVTVAAPMPVVGGAPVDAVVTVA